MSATNGMRLAALTNILGILVFSRGFTNHYLGELFPALFGPWGLACIILWGLAYGSVATRYRQVPGLLLVFALEKLVYVASWVWWLTAHGGELPAIWSQDLLTALFYYLYGVIDLSFGVFFFSLWRSSRE